MMNNYQIPTKCPKCGGELSDCWDGEPVSAFVGEWSDDRFRCEGHLIEAKDDVFTDGKGNRIAWYNRTKSCGYFGLEDFGVEYREMSNYQQLRIVLDTYVGLPELQYNRIKYTYKCGHDAQFSLEMIRKLRQTKGVARCYLRKRKSGAIVRLILVDKK